LASAASQTPLAQIAAPTAALHAPVSAGLWPATLGMLVPLGSFAVHVPALHQLPPPQSESRRQLVPHVPAVVSQ
jgi:hypothetical protein